MTEDEAKAWLQTSLNVSHETLTMLERYVAMVLDEMTRQNLIAPSTAEHIWARHIVDSAQLLLHCDREREDGLWLDLGSGAGFPGLVVAIMTQRPVLMVESRATVAAMKLESVPQVTADVISARAFAPLPKLLTLAARFSDEHTRWVLPKGQNAAIELEDTRRHWVAHFQIRQSVTSDESGILVGTLRGKRR